MDNEGKTPSCFSNRFSGINLQAMRPGQGDMREKSIELGRCFVWLFVFAYPLNFLWESFHAVFLYAGHDFTSKKYVLMIAYASAMDSLLILCVYLIVSFLWRDIFWLRRFSGKQVFTSVVIGLLIAAAIEYWNVTVIKLWSYESLMPAPFGIGLSPLTQLSLTGLISFLLTRRILYLKGRYADR